MVSKVVGAVCTLQAKYNEVSKGSRIFYLKFPGTLDFLKI
jgi:hypothetical protein